MKLSMSRFWTTVTGLSMIAIGVNIVTYLHDPVEILQFLGIWLATEGVMVLIFLVATIITRQGRR